jgi:hypothetical protein
VPDFRYETAIFESRRADNRRQIVLSAAEVVGLSVQIIWKQTWPDRENDGVAACDALPGISARVYLAAGGQEWYWFVNGDAAISRGVETSKANAKAAVEAEFERLTEER